MFVNDRVRVEKLERDAPEDRSAFVGRDGVLTHRVNVAWDPDVGSLWQVRLDDGTVSVFAEGELVVLGDDGSAVPSEMEALKETWGQAPRAASTPFRRRLPGSAAQAVLAFIVLSLAGLLLIGAGIAQGDVRISAAGGALIVVGLGAAALMVS